MKKTLICLFAIGTLAGAEETWGLDLSLRPLEEESGWTIGHQNTQKTANPDINADSGTLTYTEGNWSRGYAVYTLDSPIVLQNVQDTLTFAMTIQTSDTNSLIVGTLIGSDSALAFGQGNYNTDVQMGTTDAEPGDFYNLQRSDTGGTYVTPSSTASGIFSANTPLTLTSSIAWDANENAFIATVTYGDGDTVLGKANLGQSFSLEQISLSTDGASTQTISDVQLSAHILIPEPATATLSLLALSALCLRRRRK